MALALAGVFYFIITAIGFEYVRKTYSRTKAAVAVAGLLLVLGLADASAFSYLPSWTAVWLGLLTGLWLINAATSLRSFKALDTATTFIALVGLAWLAQGELRVCVRFMLAGATLSAIYGIVQRGLKYEPLKTMSNAQHHYAIGFIGNENMHGSFLVGQIFLGLWLVGLGEWWWIPAILVMGITLYLTRCKTAMLGLAVGGFIYICGYVNPIFALIDAVFFSLMAYLILIMPNRKIEFGGTWKERKNYWKVALEYVKSRLLLGGGFDHIRCEVPYVQRQLNIKSDGEFLKFENYECPYPQRMHSDFVQSICDNGLIGAGLLYGLVGTILWQSYPLLDQQTWPLFAAMVALLTCGLFLHTLYIWPSGLGFWTVLFGLAALLPGEELVVSGWLKWVLWTAFLLLATQISFKALLASMYESKYFATNGRFRPHKMFELVPTCGFMHNHLTAEAQRLGKLGPLFYHARSALEQYDGDQRLWELYHNLALALMAGGSMALARDCAVQAVTLWPAYEPARRTINQIDTIMGNINGQITR